MLGKTANGLFWMYRYLERAENIARLVETGQRMSLTRMGEDEGEWGSVLQSAGVMTDYTKHYDEVDRDGAVDWLLRSKKNSSSVFSCLAAARQNARLVRTAITGEVWEATNAAYMSAGEMLARRVPERDLPNVLRSLRQQTALVRGMTHGTMLRSENYDFARLGTFLERADNTARILDVKYYILLPSVSAVGSALDNVQWESILRSVSARGGFRMQHGPGGGPQEIAEFLILDTRMPRSLAFCTSKLLDNLGYLNRGRVEQTPSLKQVDRFHRKYLCHGIDEIFDYGLHEFIQNVLGEIGNIARQIEIDYRFYA